MGEERVTRAPVEFVTAERLTALSRSARGQARGRTNQNFHAPEDGYQRMLNAIQPGSYVRPHRHVAPGKSETFVVLTGEIGFFWFDDDGGLLGARRIGSDQETRAVDLQPGVWHCFLALAPDTVVFEGKNGPYDAATDKQFPAWAPAEGDPSASAYARTLLGVLTASHP
jgi:cupin fold WbuC family metalloprotein